jgi:myo-inositol-1(or 4)-monophosphatase
MATRDDAPRSLSGRPAAEIAEQAVREAGETLQNAFRGSFSVDRKGRGNFVTEVDVRIEDAVVSLLQREFPDVGVVGEESGDTHGASRYSWVVDPIDGTANFANGIPHFSTTVALLGPDGDPVLGCTYDPIRDDLFTASVGDGAFVNGERMMPGTLSTISDGVLGMDLPYGDDLIDTSFNMIRTMLPVQRVRILGSGALGLAYVATGWFDLHFHLALKPWDVAAGLIMVREAGAEVRDAHGLRATPESGSFVSGNETLLSEFHAKIGDLNHGVPQT